MTGMSTADAPQRRVLWGDECVAAIRRARQDHWQSGKEVVRHALHATGLTGLLHRSRAARGFHVDRYLRDDVAETFRAAYRTGGWVHEEGQESRSGIGSSAAVTAGLLPAVRTVMHRLGAMSLVDVGCGDWNWLRRETIDFAYTGIDVVPEVIEENRRHERPGVAFAVCNAIEGPIPPADLALCREMLFHLSFADARAVVRNIKASARFLVATTDLDIWFNADIRSGDFRRINLLRRPFSFPPPLALVPDGGLVAARYLGVWETCRIA